MLIRFLLDKQSFFKASQLYIQNFRRFNYKNKVVFNNSYNRNKDITYDLDKKQDILNFSTIYRT